MQNERIVTPNPIARIVMNNRPFQRNVKTYVDSAALIPCAQRGEHIPEILLHVGQVIDRYPRLNGSRADLDVVGACATLPDIAWHSGPHLGTVVHFSGQVLLNQFPLLAQQYAAGALKNAAWYDGSHVLQTVNTALEAYGNRKSDRIRFDCIRAVSYAIRHTPSLMMTRSEVMSFLLSSLEDPNSIIRSHASSLLQ